MLIGYGRAGLKDHAVEVQEQRLRAAGCDLLFIDRTPVSYRVRGPELEAALAALSAEDVLVVTKLSCLADTVADLRALLVSPQLTHVQLSCLDEHSAIITPEQSALVINVLGAVMDLESQGHRRARQRGIWEAKKALKYKGRAPSIDRVRVLELQRQGLNISEIAKTLGVARQSIDRILKELLASGHQP